MNTLTGFLSAITNEFKSATGINLDTVHPAPLVSQIATTSSQPPAPTSKSPTRR